MESRKDKRVKAEEVGGCPYGTRVLEISIQRTRSKAGRGLRKQGAKQGGGELEIKGQSKRDELGVDRAPTEQLLQLPRQLPPPLQPQLIVRMILAPFNSLPYQ